MVNTTCQLVPVAVAVVPGPEGLFSPDTGLDTGLDAGLDGGNWATVTLTGDTEYLLTLTGPGEATIRIHDAEGNLVHDSGDGATGAAFVAAADGTYYIQTIPADGTDAGTGAATGVDTGASFAIAVSTGLTGGTITPSSGTASITQMANYLTTGFWRETGQIPHSFDTGASNVLTVNLSGLRPADREMARDALDAWAMVANVTFREVSGSADITFDDNEPGAFASYSTYTNGETISTKVNISSSFSDQNGKGTGSYTYQTYIHEIGHALGLGHAGNYGSSGGTRYANDSWQLSSMSYYSQSSSPQVKADKAVIVTPMMADVTAIQMLYGKPAAGGATAGNTVYGKGATTGTYLDAVFSGKEGSLARNAMIIYDQGGIDRIDFSSDTAAQRVDLNGGKFSDVYGLTGNLGIAQGTMIENYVAGSAADKVTGNTAANNIQGRNGNDRLDGMGGNDKLYGGNNNDQLYGGAGNDRLEGGEGNDKAWGGAGNDKAYGQNGSDTLYGDAGNDLLDGGGHNDQLFGGDGNDTLFGGAGNDKLNGGRGNDTMTGGSGSDVFVFTGGKDRITDFQDNTDTLQLDDALWGGRKMSVAQVLDTYGRVVNGDVVLDFGNGHQITVEDVARTQMLTDDIVFI